MIQSLYRIYMLTQSRHSYQISCGNCRAVGEGEVFCCPALHRDCDSNIAKVDSSGERVYTYMLQSAQPAWFL